MIKKIVFTVTPIFSIPPRGAAAVESWMYHVATRTSFQNKIVCIKNEGYNRYDKINENCSIHRIHFSRIYKRIFQKWTRLDPIPYSQRILKIKYGFAENDECVVIVHNSMKLYGQIKRKSPNTNVVIHLHNAFEPKFLTSNDRIIVPSLFLKNFYQERVPGAEIKVVPNGFSSENYNNEKEFLSKEDIGLSDDDIVLVYAGRIVPEKGPLLLLEAFSLLHEKYKNKKLIFIGDYGIENEKNYYQYRKEFCKRAREIGDACLLLGEKSPDEIHKYYGLADLVIIPSQFQEPFCMVAIEAMASGAPVLVSTRGAMPEFVEHGITGFHLREPMTADSILQDIEQTLSCRELNKIAKQGRAVVNENFSWEHVVKVFEETLNEWFE